MDSLFISERILVNKKIIAGGILVSNVDGIIKEIFTSQEEINSWMFKEHGSDVYDYGNKIIMPGLVDSNVNICSGTDLEDFATLTKAAACGGFTTIVDNPMFSFPATTNMKNFKTKVSEARKNCLYVDCAFWGGVNGQNNNELLMMANNGVCGFKAFLNPQDGYPDFSHLTKESLIEALQILEETDCVLAIKPDLELKEPNIPEDAKIKEYSTYLSSKPSSIEKCGIEMILDVIKNHKMNIHLTDISSAKNLAMIQKYQQQKNPKISKLSFETSHHYLALKSEEIGNGKTEFKCMPPIRNNSNRNYLLDAIKSYEVFNVSSSHMPCSIATKCLIGGKNRGNFIEAANGISSLQFGLPIFWTACQNINLTICDVNRFLSKHPATLCGLHKNKGKIEVGFDADFCVWDPDECFTVSKEEIMFKNKICPYIGKELRGRIYATIVRGFVVYDANDPSFGEPIGNVLLKKAVKRCQREIRFADDAFE